MNEISNMDLYHLCRNRPVCGYRFRDSVAVVLHRRPAGTRSLPRRIAWPSEPVGVPGIPLNAFDQHIKATIAEANRVNEEIATLLNTPVGNLDAQDYCDELNAQRKSPYGPA